MERKRRKIKEVNEGKMSNLWEKLRERKAKRKKERVV